MNPNNLFNMLFNNNSGEDLDYWTILSRMADQAQLASFSMELQDVRNSDLSKKIDEQNDKFLEQILKNQEEILKRLDIIEKKVNK
ncbi:MAG: hypothetical protein GX947_08515 [Tissierellia bacterium]|nr:hypothetical protein [Tissierellia bacterium]